MEESISKFVSAIIAILIMFIFPVYISYEKKDDMSYALALRYTQNFVDDVRSKGYITKEQLQDFKASLLATGNTYDVELEHDYVRYDYEKTTAENTGSAVRNIQIYGTSHIQNMLDTNGIYCMNVGDNFNVTIKNTNVTLATVIYNIVTVNMNTNNVRVYVDYGGTIKSDKWYLGNLKFSEYGGIFISEDVSIPQYKINITSKDLSN